MDPIRYKSTRGGEEVGSVQAILDGIAPDGGLYVPTSFPSWGPRLGQLAELDYRQLAAEVLGSFFADFSLEEIQAAVNAAYDDKFDHPCFAPLVEKGGYFFLELFHGPTLAFKDMALSVLPHLVQLARTKLGRKDELVILTATSGDTGKAALEGFADVEGTRIIVFYPQEGVSKIQERQMVTQRGENTHVVAIRGNFDDAQGGVKEAFSDQQFRSLAKRAGFSFSSANSINIGRLIPQVVYYLYSYLELLNRGRIKAGEEINVCVPTGNFGNILAAYYARQCGVPLGRLICASNINNVLYDFINSGTYDRNRQLKLTSSPSMDILVSSNLERLLYHISGEDAVMVTRLMENLANEGRYSISPKMKDSLADFYPGFATEAETREAIASAYQELGYLIDTHTAVGFSVCRQYVQEGNSGINIIVSTASPFKFPAEVLTAIGAPAGCTDELQLIDRLAEVTGVTVPQNLRNLAQLPVRHTAVCSQAGIRQQIKSILGIEAQQ